MRAGQDQENGPGAMDKADAGTLWREEGGKAIFF